MKNKSTTLQQNQDLFRRWSASYDWKLFQFWMKRFQVPVLKILAKEPAAVKVLDVSCGTGQLLSSLVQQGKKDLFGVDLSKEMLAKAREKLHSFVQLQEGEVTQLPYPDQSFDYVISTEAFHHYPDQKKALREMKRVCKEKGKVMVVDINFFLPFFHWLFPKIEPGCVKVNNKREMKALFEEAGFRNIRQQRSFMFAVMTEGVKIQ